MLSGFVCRPIGWPSTKNQQHVSLNWHLDQQTQMFAKKEKKKPDPFIFHNTPPIVNGEAKTHIKM